MSDQGELSLDRRRTRQDEIREAFLEFDARVPEFWVTFKDYTFERIGRGYQHYSATGVFERARWDSPIGDDGVLAFKVNNNFKRKYAEKFVTAFPQYADFFEFREQTSDHNPPRNRPESTPDEMHRVAPPSGSCICRTRPPKILYGSSAKCSRCGRVWKVGEE